MKIEERVRRGLDAEGARMTPRKGDVRSVIRRGRRRRMAVATTVAAAAVAAVVVPGVLFLADGRSGPPIADGTTPTTVPTTAPTTTPVPDSTTTTAASTTTTSPPTQVPDTESVPVVVAGADGVVFVRDGEVVERLQIGPVVLAVDDLNGGVVFQVGTSASSIAWMASGADAASEIIPSGTDEALELHEVVEIDGHATVVYTSRVLGAAPEDTSEELRLHDLVTGDDDVVASVGGYESGPFRVSYADGGFLVSMTAEGTTWFEFLDAGGAPIEVAANPRTERESATDFLVWVSHGALSPDGSTMAFMRGSPRSEAPFSLVIVDLDTGGVVEETPIEGAHESTVTRVEWDGRTAVVSLREAEAVVVQDGAAVGHIPVAGPAARSHPTG